MKIVDIESKQATVLSFELLASKTAGEWAQPTEVNKLSAVLVEVERQKLVPDFSLADTDLILDEADNYLIMQGMSEYFSIK